MIEVFRLDLSDARQQFDEYPGPGVRVYQSEIEKKGKTQRLWMRRRRVNRGLICSGCGWKFTDARDEIERSLGRAYQRRGANNRFACCSTTSQQLSGRRARRTR